MINETEEKIWRPTLFLGSQAPKYAVIVLNTPISNVESFAAICSAAQYLVAADGGANRIYDLHMGDENPGRPTPDVIVGDLDSIRDDVRRHYEIQGMLFERDNDLYATDFSKSLKHLRSIRSQRSLGLDILVFGGLGGRPDQAFAQLHQIVTASQDTSLVPGDLYLFTGEGIVFLLEKGMNRIDTADYPQLIGESIGIIPLGKSAIITTKGLEWDVEDWETSFGTQVSTSNHIKAPKVEVMTSERVLFTLELASHS